MTRILASGDWHAGVSAVALAEQEKVWHRIVDAALENDVDLFLHGGDVFEGPVVTPEQMRAVLNPLKRLVDDRIPVLICLGNGKHDAAMRAVHGLDVFNEIPGIQVVSRAENIEFARQALMGLVITTLPWTPMAKKISEEEGFDTGQVLVQVARDLHQEAGQHATVNLLLTHWSISSANLPNGLPVSDLREPVLEWADLDSIGFDAVIAAHIHKSQRLDDPELGDSTMGVYVGSPQPLNHGEAGYDHGCYLIDVEPGAVSLEFVPVESPSFVTYEIPATEEFLVAPSLPWFGQGDIVRVRYEATREQDAVVDKDAIRRDLLAAGASRVTIEPTIIREVRARDERVTKDLSETDALAAYAAAQKIDPVMAGRMGERLREWVVS